MDGKFFTKETKGLIKKAVEDAIKLPFWAEPFDGPAIDIILKIIDKNADKVVPDIFDQSINEVVTLAFEGEFEAAEAKIAEVLNNLIDIPYIDEETELMVFKNALGLIVSLIKQWIEKKKNS